MMETQDTTSSVYRILIGLISLTAPPIVLSPTALVAYGTTSAFPNTIATLTNWDIPLLWACYEFVDGENDIEIDAGEILTPLPEQEIISTAFTKIGARFYFAAGNTGVFDTSTLSPANNGEV